MRKWWIGLVIVLAFSSLLVPWMVFESELEFTSGKPERSIIILESEVNSDSQYNTIEVEKATPFFLWMFSREDVAEYEETNEPAREEVNPTRLDNTRMLMHFLVLLQVTACVILFSGLGIKKRYAIIIWIVGLLTLAMVVPWAWMSDSAEVMSAGETWQGQGFEEEQTFIHSEFEYQFNWGISGISLSHSGSGWDLGMVDADNRTLIKEGPPENHPSQEDALISWEGELGLSFGLALLFWVLSLLPIIFGPILDELIKGKLGPKNDESQNYSIDSLHFISDKSHTSAVDE